MNSYTEHLNKRVMDQAYEIGVLRGTLKGILNGQGRMFTSDTRKRIEEVLKRTDNDPAGPEIPVEHNGSPQVEVSEELD